MEPFHFCATVMSGDFSKYVTLIATVKEKICSKNKRNIKKIYVDKVMSDDKIAKSEGLYFDENQSKKRKKSLSSRIMTDLLMIL